MSGTIPKLRFKEFKDDWRIDALEPHVDILSGVPLKSDEISEDEKGVPILRGINITEGFIRHSKDIDRYYLSSTKQVEKFLVAKGDLVIGMDGSKVGKNVALVSESDSGAILIQRVARIRSRHTSDIRFIYHHIFSPKFHRYVDEVNTSSGIPHISLKQINEFKIGFPSLPEQQKVASFLSAVDEKIQQLTRKKELLAEYKKGVMQQLFSGKLRFKDENGNPYPKWEEKKLGEVCEINPSTKEVPEAFIYIDLESVSKGQLVQENRITKDEAPSRAQRTLQPNDILYQTVRPYQMNNYLFDKKGDYVASTGYAQIRTNQETRYIYQLLHSEDFVNEVMERCTGTSFPAINSKDLGKIEVPVPHKEEQQKIARFLTALDAKIESVATQIAHTQTFKKGLLQQMFV